MVSKESVGVNRTDKINLNPYLNLNIVKMFWQSFGILKICGRARFRQNAIKWVWRSMKNIVPWIA